MLSCVDGVAAHALTPSPPAGLRHSVSSEMVPVLRAARDLLIERLQVIEGSSVEDNRFSVSVHWRNCAVDDRPAVEAIVDSTLSEAPFAGVLRKNSCLLYTSPSPRDATLSRMPSSA